MHSYRYHFYHRWKVFLDQEAAFRFPLSPPQALTDQQQFGKADEMYDKCIELEPDNATTYVHKG